MEDGDQYVIYHIVFIIFIMKMYIYVYTFQSPNLAI